MRRFAVAIQESWDAMFARMYYPVICLALAAMTFYTARRALELSRDWDEWSVADWLVSYAAGFARRGLSGELVLRISTAFGVALNMVAFGIIAALFAALSVLIALLLRRRQITFWYFVLCLSPAFLFFTFYDPFTVGRKEILLYVAFCAWALMLTAGRGYPGTRAHVAFGIACLVLTLMHEVFAFYSLYFVLVSFLMARERGMPERWRRSLILPACSLLALAIVTLFSASITDPAQCSRLIALGAPRDVCGGVLTFEVGTAGDALKGFVSGFEPAALAGLAGVFPLVLVPLYVFLLANTEHTSAARTMTGLVCALIVVSLPLFVVGRDWGRWISIHIVLSTITCAVLLPEKARAAPSVSGRAAALPLIAGSCVVCSMFLWSLRHCCQYEYLNAFGPLERLLQ
jgi:hypothetical protein